MYRLTSQATSRKINPKDAQSFLELNNFAGQRALHEDKARRYSELLMRGELRPVDIAFALCPDGNRYLMNGQHVCQGCIWAGKEMNAVITHYKCDTWDDAWKLFATFDVHACRTQNQIFSAARGLLSCEGLHTVPLRVLSTCGTALACLEGGKVNFGNHTKTADKTTKPMLVDRHSKDVLWVSTFADADFMLRVGCVAAMIATRRKNPEKAEEFWRKIANGLGFKSKTEPQKRLHDYLQNPNQFLSNTRSRHENVYATCISWWNSFITGQPRNYVKIAAMQELPKVQ